MIVGKKVLEVELGGVSEAGKHEVLAQVA